MNHRITLALVLSACTLNPAQAFQSASSVVSSRNSWGATPTSAARSSNKRSCSSSSTRLQTVSFDGAASAIDSFYQTQPYVSAFLTCSVKASAADFFAQTSQEDSSDATTTTTSTDSSSSNSKTASTVKAATTTAAAAVSAVDTTQEQTVDLQRNMAFIFYGGLYSGLAQQFIYTVLFPAWFGDGHTWQSIATQVGLDMTVVGPFLCLPLAYIVKTVFTADEITVGEIKAGISKYVEDVTTRGLLFKYWMVWMPAQTFNFCVIPEHLRILFIAAVSFFWMFILSSTAAATTDDQQDVVSPATTGAALPKRL